MGMKVNCKRFVLAGMLGVSLATISQAKSAQGQAAAYRNLGIDARILGLGGAGVAVSSDVNATYWNPAGLAGVKGKEAAAMHTSLSLDRNYNYLGYARPMGKDGWVLGVAYHRFSVDGIPETRIHSGLDVDGNGRFDDPILTGEVDGAPLAAGRATAPVRIFSYFEDAESNISISAAKQVNPRLNLGGTVRYLEQELFTESADGVGFDFGVQYKASKRVTLGASFRDMFESLKWTTGRKDTVPITATVGGAFQVNQSTLIALDGVKREREEVGLRLGVEKWFAEKYGLRLGTNEGEFTAGASAKYEEWTFDYAYNDQDLGNVQRISAKRRF